MAKGKKAKSRLMLGARKLTKTIFKQASSARDLIKGLTKAGLNKSISQMNVKELKNYIRIMTERANKRFMRYDKKGKIIGTVEQERNKLQQIGAKKGSKIGLGFAGKRKNDLIRQARELSYFEKWDIFTPKGKHELKEREKKAFEEFNSNHDNMDYEDWRSMVEVFGAVGDSILNQFGSNNIVELLNDEEIDNEDRLNLMSYMKDVIKESKGKGYTPEDMIDLLREKMLN